MLADQNCEPCTKGTPKLDRVECQKLKPEVPNWQVIDDHGVTKIRRFFRFKDFVEALAFTNQVGELAEAADHHPLLVTEWGAVTVVWWTHSICGLHQNDFVMAAKTDRLASSLKITH